MVDFPSYWKLYQGLGYRYVIVKQLGPKSLMSIHLNTPATYPSLSNGTTDDCPLIQRSQDEDFFCD